MPALRIKICGVTSPADALLALDRGADWVGVNLIESSRRHVALDEARRIADAVDDEERVVAVVADSSAAALERLRSATGIRWLQLHGGESPDDVSAVMPGAYKAVRIGGPEDVVDAERYPGDLVLTDARVRALLGGTGRTFDWDLVSELATRRAVMLAGGLSAENVAAAVKRVAPWGVDVAGGVEEPGNPRRKSPTRLRAFVQAARSVDGSG